MPVTITLCLLAPLAVYIGLNLANSAALTFLLYHGLLCAAAPLIDLIFIKKNSAGAMLRTLGFTKFKQNLLPAIGIGLLFGVTTYLFLYLMRPHILAQDQIELVLAQWRINPRYIVPFLTMMVIGNSILEEIYWRGYIYWRLEKNNAPIVTIGITAIFYTSYHLITTVSLFPLRYALLFSGVIFGIALFWGFMRRRTGSIYLPIITHLLADLGFMLIYFQFFGR
jgi:CAAX protease family protein